jgi:hypothetical protein
MSSFNVESMSRVPLLVEAADQATELAVLDGQLRVIGRGLGRLEMSLEPGLYKFKAHAGGAIDEQRVVLTGHSDPVRFPPLPFVSPVPLAGTARTGDAWLQDAAVRESGRVHKSIGEGSSIYLFVHVDARAADDPAHGLTLHDGGEKGACLLDFRAQSASGSSPGGAAWAACRVQVSPGAYRLRWTRRSGPMLEQTIVASAGWQTQVFLAWGPDPSEPDRTCFDRSDASIRMVRDGKMAEGSLRPTFDPADPLLRVTELARLGLADGRRVLADPVFRELVDDLIDDPMLGLFGAHMLLLEHGSGRYPGRIDLRPVDAYLQSLSRSDVSFGTVVENLRRLVGEGTHPDVEALGLLLEAGGCGYRFEVPPMLRQSWALVVAATADHPEFVPADSLSSQVARGLWKEEPWLLWTVPGTESGAIAEDGQDDFEEALVHQIQRFQRKSRIDHQARLRSFPADSVESIAAREGSALDARRAVNPSIDPTASTPDFMHTLVLSLGLPRATIEQLIEKMAARPGTPGNPVSS